MTKEVANSEVLIVKQKNIIFTGKADQNQMESCVIFNNCRQPLQWRLRTTNNDRLKSKPANGILQPQKSQQIELSCYPYETVLLNRKTTILDQLTIQYTKLHQNQDFTADFKTNAKMNEKPDQIPCQLIQVHYKPVLPKPVVEQSPTVAKMKVVAVEQPKKSNQIDKKASKSTVNFVEGEPVVTTVTTQPPVTKLENKTGLIVQEPETILVPAVDTKEKQVVQQHKTKSKTNIQAIAKAATDQKVTAKNPTPNPTLPSPPATDEGKKSPRKTKPPENDKLKKRQSKGVVIIIQQPASKDNSKESTDVKKKESQCSTTTASDPSPVTADNLASGQIPPSIIGSSPQAMPHLEPVEQRTTITIEEPQPPPPILLAPDGATPENTTTTPPVASAKPEEPKPVKQEEGEAPVDI